MHFKFNFAFWVKTLLIYKNSVFKDRYNYIG